MIINSYIFGSGVSDADAQAFITAAAITDNTQKNAINNLVINLKAAGIWSKMKAVYPFVGGTASSHKWNLKDPRDLNAAFRLSFLGGWTHTSNGVQANGTNGYADTFFVPSAQYSVDNNHHISVYSRLNQTQNDVELGAFDGTRALQLRVFFSSGTEFYSNNLTPVNPTDTNSVGNYIGNRIGTSVKVFKNNTTLGSFTNSTNGRPTVSLFLANSNNSGSPNAGLYSNKQYAFSSIGDGLTDSEALLFNQIVETYQYTLSRNVNPVNPNYYTTSYANETNVFLYASEITDSTQKNAINNLVVNMKAAGIWTKMKAIYPMIGGTASTHKWNLINPQDTDAAFRLTFTGGWTHSSTGALPNGTNGYANTFLANNNMLNTSIHYSYYSRTNTLLNCQEMGVLHDSAGSPPLGGNSYSDLSVRNSGGGAFIRLNNSGGVTFATNLDSRGFYTGTRTASNVLKLFKNNSIIQSLTDSASLSSTIPIYIGALNNNGTSVVAYSNRECAFSSIGDGLIDSEALLFNQIVETYQFALSRNINPTNPNYYNTSYANETNTFLYASEITDNTQKNAINNLVINMKAAGIWSKMKAVYPFVGGTASTHKWNLVNPQDTNAAYRLIFNGGWTHTTNGAQPNGTNGYADTRLNMSSNYAVNDNAHISFYSRTSTNSTVPNYDMGTYDNVHYSGAVAARSSLSYYAINFNNSQNYISFADTNGAALYISNRIGTTVNGWRNNIKGIQATLATTGRPNSTMYLGNLNVNGAPNSGLWSFRQYAFCTIGDGLTDTEAADFYTVVQNFNTALARNI